MRVLVKGVSKKTESGFLVGSMRVGKSDKIRARSSRSGRFYACVGKKGSSATASLAVAVGSMRVLVKVTKSSRKLCVLIGSMRVSLKQQTLLV